MSQLLLQVQLRLQSQKLKKNQSAQWTSDSLDERVAALVLLHFFWRKFKEVKYERREAFDARQNRFILALLGDKVDKSYLPPHPSKELTAGYPTVVTCQCGKILAEDNFGVVEYCFSCLGAETRKTAFYSKLRGSLSCDLFYISNAWHDWAESVAIQLETKRKANRNGVPAFGETK